jgi:hypothetical protein
LSVIDVYTCAAANYLPKVRVLFETVRKHRPEWRLHLALADEPPPAAAFAKFPPHELHRLDQLDIPNRKGWTFCHSLIELATGIKPFALKRLLARPDCGGVIYLDPDIAVFSGLERVEAALATHDIALTPHLTAPERTHDGILANEICTAQHGIYNLGFIGVAATPDGRAFADWWADRVYRFCREDIPNGLYTDQRWVEFAAAYFDRVAVLRSATLNAAPWNLAQRQLAGKAPDSLTVNGAPLDFFHFSQVDGLSEEILSGGQSAVRNLLKWYKTATRPAGQEKQVRGPWAMGAFEDGDPILMEQRLVYRLRGDLQEAFPDPYRADAESYLGWWRSEAKREFPALFDPARREDELRTLTSTLATGHFSDKAVVG